MTTVEEAIGILNSIVFYLAAWITVLGGILALVRYKSKIHFVFFGRLSGIRVLRHSSPALDSVLQKIQTSLSDKDKILTWSVSLSPGLLILFPAILPRVLESPLVMFFWSVGFAVMIVVSARVTEGRVRAVFNAAAFSATELREASALYVWLDGLTVMWYVTCSVLGILLVYQFWMGFVPPSFQLLYPLTTIALLGSFSLNVLLRTTRTGRSIEDAAYQRLEVESNGPVVFDLKILSGTKGRSRQAKGALIDLRDVCLLRRPDGTTHPIEWSRILEASASR